MEQFAIASLPFTVTVVRTCCLHPVGRVRLDISEPVPDVPNSRNTTLFAAVVVKFIDGEVFVVASNALLAINTFAPMPANTE